MTRFQGTGGWPRETGRSLVAIGRRSRRLVLLAGLTGVLTGLAVAGFEAVTAEGAFSWLLHQPLGLQAAAPGVGLVLAALMLRWLARGAGPATADEYIQNYHQEGVRLDQRPVAGRLAAAVATLGCGGALGYEGPSVYLGASLGDRIQHRMARYFSRADFKMLLVSGAAAGVAAIFRAPLTGLIFALEAPYQDDLARRMLLPASIAAAASYVTYAALVGTRPLLPVAGQPPFDLRDLGGAAIVGLLCGAGARSFAWLVSRAKALAGGPLPGRLAASAAVLAALVVASDVVAGEPLSLGAGYEALEWVLDPERSVPVVVALLLLRGLATITTLAGGGVGGLFIPLVIQGAFLGRLLGDLLGAPSSTLFPLIGMAAFLGAGYRVPLAAVVFVAESTGRPGFVVPGLIAAVVAQLVMGRSSVSSYQRTPRGGHLERRFELPVSAALRADVLIAPPDCTVEELFWHHLVGTRQRTVPIVDGKGTYLGIARLAELDQVAQAEWGSTPVTRIMRTDYPTGRAHWLLREALEVMEGHDVDRLPVVDDADRFVGVVTMSQIVKLDEILERGTGPDDERHQA